MIKVNYEEIKKEVFPNGETRLDLRPVLANPVAEKEYFFEWKYESDADFFTLELIIDYIKEHDADWNKKVTILNILYMPYSRMDRSENGSVFSLKTAAKIINSWKFKIVSIFEAHSEKTTQLIDNSSSIPISAVLLDEALLSLKQSSDLPVYVFYPDKGAKARYDMPEMPCLTGSKKRDFETGRITAYEIDNPEDLKHGIFNVVIVDDLTSYGGTFIAAAKLLQELGASDIILAVTHCEEAAFQGDLLKYIDVLFTTNSITNSESFAENGRFVHVENLFETLEESSI